MSAAKDTMSSLFRFRQRPAHGFGAAAAPTAAARVSLPMLGAVALGAILRILQYAGDPALSLDELAVARNVLDRGLWDLLTRPLAFDQTAPKGFLLATKIAIHVFGASDAALRLFPLLCSLAALIVFSRMAARILDQGAALIAMLLFAVAMPLIEYSGVMKQYAGDVAVAVMLAWLAHHLLPGEITRRRALWTGVTGAVLVWFSHAAVFVLTGLSAVLIFVYWRCGPGPEARRWSLVAPVLVLWAASGAALVLASLASMTPATHEYMRRYWSSGFMPWPPLRAAAILWPWRRLLAAVEGIGYPAPVLYVFLMVSGFAFLLRRRPIPGLLLLAPIAVTFGAAVLRQYPFSDRLILFLMPSFLLGIAAGIDGLRRIAASYSAIASAALLAVTLGPALYATARNPPVYQIENIKPVLARLQAQRGPGDKVYVYYGAAAAVRFYDAEYRLAEHEYVLGGCHRGENRRYLEELDRFRGSERLWIVLTHAFPLYREREDILGYLDAIGSRREAFSVPAKTAVGNGLPAELFLYDLSDANRLQQAAAASYATYGRATHGQFTCGHGAGR